MDWNLIGLAIFWWGIGAGTVATAWAAKNKKDAERVLRLVKEVFKEGPTLGHVIDFHPVGATQMHAHCICGEASLSYETTDPQGDRLMTQWAENHIDTKMESVGR